MPLILASTSPYRRQLLERLGLEFSVEAPGVDERPVAPESPPERATRLAEAKARAVAVRQADAVVIGSDQVACIGTEVLRKPGDAARARAQLAQLSGSTAWFHTACTVQRAQSGFSATHLNTTAVVFRTLSSAEIERYVARERPFDCAGAFKSESLGVSLLERIDSVDPNALIGLPLIWLAATLRQLGFAVP